MTARGAIVRRAQALLLALATVSCGYTQNPAGRAPWPVEIRTVVEEQADLDAGADLQAALRRHIARQSWMKLDPGAPNTLNVTLERVALDLGALSEPALRAAQYRVQVEVSAELMRAGRTEKLRSVGSDEFVAPAGRLEALDGARRASLARATDVAAERLLRRLKHLAFAPPPRPERDDR